MNFADFHLIALGDGFPEKYIQRKTVLLTLAENARRFELHNRKSGIGVPKQAGTTTEKFNETDCNEWFAEFKEE